MALAAKSLARFDVSGEDNTLNYRWKTLIGSTQNDSITLNKMYLGGYGKVNLGSGTDSVTMAEQGDWTMLLIGVESVRTTQADTTLTIVSDAELTTDGSFTAITAGYGTQVITFTGLIRDTVVSLGDSEDRVFFSKDATRWRYQAQDDGSVFVYDLNTGMKATLNGSNIENLVIETGTDPDEAPVDVQVDDLVPDQEGGTSIAATIPVADDGDAIIFDATSINFTPELGGFAQAYGFLWPQDGSVSWGTNNFYLGYFEQFQMLGLARLQAGTETTIDLNGTDDYYTYYGGAGRSNPLAYRTGGTDANASTASDSFIFDGWLRAYLQDSKGDFVFSVGATRLIMGSDNADTGGAINQSSDTLNSNSYFNHFYDSRTDGGYAMYGWGGEDSITGSANNDTIWGGAHNDTITGGLGDDRLFGDTHITGETLGNDVFVFNMTGSAATVVEGAGNDKGGDQIRDFDAETSTDAEVDLIRISVTNADDDWSINTHVMVGTAGATTDTGNAASYVAATYLVQAGDHTGTSDAFDIVVNVTSDGTATNSGSTAAFANAAAARTYTSVNLTGNAQSETIVLGANADTVNAAAGDDTITGGDGADNLDGGTGSNTFRFNTGDVDSGETVTFSGTTDTFQVDSSTDFSSLNSGSALTGLDVVSLNHTNATFLAAQVTGRTFSVTDTAAGATGTVLVSGTTAADTINLSSITLDGNSQTSVSGGNNADVITGTSGVDIILGEAGNDQITGGAGADSLDGGAGDDSFTFADRAAIVADTTIIGGDNTDTITISAVVSASLDLDSQANIATVESLVLSLGSTATVTLDTAMTDATVTSGAADITLSTAGQDVDGAANGALTVRTTDTLLAASIIKGDNSSGDTLVISNQVTTARNLGTYADLQGVEALTLAAGSTAAVTLDTEMTSVTLGAAGSVVLTTAGQDVTGSAGADTVDTGALTSFAGTVLALSGATDTLTVSTNSSNLAGINSGADTTAETLVISGLASTTMTAAQHAGFTTITANGTAGTAETVTISTQATALALDADVETYVLGNFTNSVTLGAAAQNVTGNATAGDDTINTGSLTTISGTINGVIGTDILVVQADSTLSASLSNIDEVQLASGVDITTSIANNALITTAAGTNIVTLSEAGTATGASAVETYVLANGANTFTLGAAAQNVTGNATAGDDTINTGSLTTISGTINGVIGTDILVVQADSTLSASLSNIDEVQLASGVDITTSIANNALITTAAGTNIVTLSEAGTATGASAVETYVLANGANTFTLGAAAQNVTGNATAGDDTINTGSLTTISGTINGVIGTDILVVQADSTLSASLSNIDEVQLASGVDITTSIANNALITTAAGTNIVTLSEAGTATGASAVETYVLANGANTFTLGAAAQNVTGNATAGDDTINTGSLTTISGTINGVIGTDILVVQADSTLSASLSNIDEVQLASGVDITTSIANNALITTAAGTNIVTLSEAGTATGASAVETYVLANGANTFTSGAASHSITGGADNDNINGEAGDDTITGGAGNDTLSGGSEDDRFNFSGTTDADVIDGGAGNDDVLWFTGTTDFTQSTTTNVEYIVIEGGATVTFAGAELDAKTYNIASGVNTSASTLQIEVTGGTTVNFSTLVFNGTLLTNSSAWSPDAYLDRVKINISDTASNVTGTTTFDSITGGAGADTIDGGAGADTIDGGAAADTISFGDTLVTNDTAGDAGDLSGSLASDTITFVVLDDTFRLDETIFGNMGDGASIGAGGGTLAPAQFALVADLTGSLNVGIDNIGNGAIVYDTVNNDLYFIEAGVDLTAAGTDSIAELLAAGNAIKIADVTLTGVLTNADFDVVQ